MGQLYHSILSNKKGSIDFESDYYSSNDSSFNTTILNENSLSLSFILKDNKGIHEFKNFNIKFFFFFFLRYNIIYIF